MLRVDPSQLHKGDIILSTDPASPISYAIRLATRSRFSHAAICTDPPFVVEAIGVGVARLSLERVLIQDRANVTVLRPVAASTAVITRVCEYAENAVARQYATIDALLSVVPAIPGVQGGKYFCSHLVASAFSASGLPLSADPPEKVTPGDLVRSDVLMDVTNLCVTGADEATIAFATGLLDGERLPSPHHVELIRKQRIVKTVKRPFREAGFEVQTYEDALGLVVAHSERNPALAQRLDVALAPAIIDSGLLSIPAEFVPPTDISFHYDLYLAQLLQHGGLVSAGLNDLRAFLTRTIANKRLVAAEATDVLDIKRRLLIQVWFESIYLDMSLTAEHVALLDRQLRALARCDEILMRIQCGSSQPPSA